MKRFSAVNIIIILVLVMAAHAAFGAETNEKRLNLNLKKVPFPEVIRNIFSGSRDKYSVDPALNDLRVSATLKNITRDQAIRVVTKTAGVIYSVENNMYTFKPDLGVARKSVQNHNAAATKGSAKIDVVTLQYISAGDAASLLNASPPDGLESITATSVNTLMIKGDADSVSQAKVLIKLFDVESALPRSVRVALSLELSTTGSKDPINLMTESVGPEGSPMPLSINFSSREKDSYMLDVRLTPSVLPDGSVSLTGSGGIDCSNYGGTPNAERMSKLFEVAASVTPGTPSVIASGWAETGTSKVKFITSVTVIVGKGRVAMPKSGLSGSGALPAQMPQNAQRLVGALNKPDEVHRKVADALLQQIWDAQPGQPKFDAVDAVVRKYKESDIADRNAIAWLCLAYMKDKGRGVLERWPCCYVISRCGYDPGVSDLIDVLLHDNMEVMRAVAAEALGGLSDNTAAYDALVQSERAESSTRVREVLARYLGNKAK